MIIVPGISVIEPIDILSPLKLLPPEYTPTLFEADICVKIGLLQLADPFWTMLILLLFVFKLVNCVVALLLFRLSHLIPVLSAIPDPLPLLMPVADELGDPTDSSDLKCYNDMI